MTLPAHLERELASLGVIAPKEPRPMIDKTPPNQWWQRGEECPF